MHDDLETKNNNRKLSIKWVSLINSAANKNNVLTIMRLCCAVPKLKCIHLFGSQPEADTLGWLGDRVLSYLLLLDILWQFLILIRKVA